MISLINHTVAFDYLQLILNNHNRSCLIVIVFYFLYKNQVDNPHSLTIKPLKNVIIS